MPEPPDADPPPTVEAPPVTTDVKPGWHVRIFGSRMFFKLWCAQVVSAMGDWIGFLAIAVAATRVGGGNPETAVGLVMAARIVPGFFLGPAAGVFVDRWDRKKVMIVCDLGRAFTLAFLPFITHVWQLLIASLILEVFTLLWSPAKEASVPNLVPPDRLTTANSLSLVAAYGTFPLASLVFALLAKVAQVLGEVGAISFLDVRQESVAFWFDTLTFCFSALMIARLHLPHLTRRQREAQHAGESQSWGQAWGELKEGWKFIFSDPTVRAVNVGLACGLIGGGMLVPLGPVFSTDVLGAGSPGFGLLTTGLGFGVAFGILILSLVQKRIRKARVFTFALFVAAGALIAAASSSTLTVAVVFVAVLGVCAGSVYILGYTMLHENVEDQMRGRAFSALYTLVRMCVLIAFAIGPLLSGLLDGVSRRFLGDARFEVGGFSAFVPGVRLTLWLAGLIIIGAGFLALRSVKAAEAAELAARAADHPAGAGEGEGETASEAPPEPPEGPRPTLASSDALPPDPPHGSVRAALPPGAAEASA